MPITLLLADDHGVVRQGLRCLLEAEPDMLVVGEASNGREALALAKELSPEVAVLDVAMPVIDGLEAARQIKRDAPETRVVILSTSDGEDYVQRAIENGASGYLVKTTASNDLIRAIREVRRGHWFLSPSLPPWLLRECRERLLHPQSREKRGNRLTPRQVEVLQGIAAGKPNKEIARALGISIKTVEKHRQDVMDRLGIHNIAGLTRYAVSHRLCTKEWNKVSIEAVALQGCP